MTAHVPLRIDSLPRLVLTMRHRTVIGLVLVAAFGGGCSASPASTPGATATIPISAPPTTVPAVTSTTPAGDLTPSTPTVTLGTAFVIHTNSQAANTTVRHVIDPVAATSSSDSVPIGSRIVGLDFSVDNLGPEPIFGIGERHEPSLVLNVLGTDDKRYGPFRAEFPGCPYFSPTTVVTMGSTFTGCAFVTLPSGVNVATVVVYLDSGGFGGNTAAWRV